LKSAPQAQSSSRPHRIVALAIAVFSLACKNPPPDTALPEAGPSGCTATEALAAARTALDGGVGTTFVDCAKTLRYTRSFDGGALVERMDDLNRFT
jgi:hypothetical protein